MVTLPKGVERLRDLGPVVLVPAAWTAGGASVLGYLSDEGMLIAHVVMAVFIAFFAVTGWSAMSRGALRGWRLVLLAGLAVTLSGLVGFLIDPSSQLLFTVSLVGWMLLPAFGLAYTARELPEAAVIYGSGAGLSVLGAALTTTGIVLDDTMLVVSGIAVVALGQTAGIVDASLRDT